MDEGNYHTFKLTKSPTRLVALILSVSAFILIVSYFYYTAALDRPAQCSVEKVFKIAKGEGTGSISERLYDQGLINSKLLFVFYAVSNNLQSKLQAGTYTIPAGCSIKNLIELFQEGRDDESVTFLEGWRVEEVAQEATTKLSNVGYEHFVEMAKKYEGQLFPDTYEFKADADENDVLKSMLENYELKTSSLFSPASLNKTGLSKDQILILASIVEREIATAGDRRIVAGILIKRFKEGQLLGADATTQYAVSSRISAKGIDWWPRKLTAEDLDIESPYNTRKLVGLPPTPICNPGLASIEAVLGFEETPYYYYLTDSQGITHYAKTLIEHNANVVKFL